MYSRSKPTTNAEHNSTGSLDISIGGQSLGHSNSPITDDGIGWGVSGRDLSNEYGIVVFLDVLGMKGIWKRVEPIIVINNWVEIVKSFTRSIQEHPPNSRYIFRILSDTIIITIPTELDPHIINWVFEVMLQPFIQSIKLKMLLRGTISYGKYHISNRLIIGQALDDAAYNHDKLNWIGISLSPSLSSEIKNNMVRVSSHSTVWYRNIPHKQLHYEGLVLNWPIFDSNEECLNVLKRQCIDVDKSVKEKYDNTFAFYNSVTNSFNP